MLLQQNESEKKTSNVIEAEKEEEKDEVSDARVEFQFRFMCEKFKHANRLSLLVNKFSRAIFIPSNIYDGAFKNIY